MWSCCNETVKSNSVRQCQHHSPNHILNAGYSYGAQCRVFGEQEYGEKRCKVPDAVLIFLFSDLDDPGINNLVEWSDNNALEINTEKMGRDCIWLTI